MDLVHADLMVNSMNITFCFQAMMHIGLCNIGCDWNLQTGSVL